MIHVTRRTWVLLAVGNLAALLICCAGSLNFNLSFVTPKKAESTETRTVAMRAGSVLQVRNDIGSTRVTVDANATTATIEIQRHALADTQSEAEDLLARMSVTVTEPTTANNKLLIEAVRPPEATEDEDNFQAVVTEDEINITAIVGSARVVQYRLRITIPPDHAVEIEQGVGQVRTVGLDTPSNLFVENGSIHSLGAKAALVANADDGDIKIESHQGDLEMDITKGSANISILSLAAGKKVDVFVGSGRIDIDLPLDINAYLRAWTGFGNVAFYEKDFNNPTNVTNTVAFVEATLGSGAADIRLQATRGSIDIDSY